MEISVFPRKCGVRLTIKGPEENCQGVAFYLGCGAEYKGGYIYHLNTTGHTHQGNQNGKKHVYPNVHRSTAYNSQDMEAT